MRLTVFIVFLVLAVVLDTRFMEAFRIGPILPSISATLAVFVVLCAPAQVALWACFTIGLLLDFSDFAIYQGTTTYCLVGPYTLGFVFGANLVLPLRSMVFSRNPLTFGILTVLFLLAVSVLYIALWQFRGLYPGSPPPWVEPTVLGELGRRLLCALYSGALAIPVGWVLVLSRPVWGFGGAATRR
ncbi:MAG: hypothetical protein VXY94_00155 [Planctomycetota bacterium]|nr:hypothetical protein [Planctomycetota bacterium]MEC8733398.1 hypothetical protein [Planctomycetota bacterium]MEC9158279.1 hypothetical protein [Planctomycetota bacterium]MEC9233625.1 hypothetical protein [Planctomycetota bacterium]MED6308219.1 hypothetical protein [Planctomycetota bacterium]